MLSKPPSLLWPLVVFVSLSQVTQLSHAAESATATGGTVTGGNVTGGTVTGGSVTGSTVKGGDVQGGSVTGGNVTGGSVTGGNVTGGSVKGGDVTGGNTTGGTVTGGNVTAGSVTSGTVSPGTATASIGGREIKAIARGSVSVQPSGTNATVRLNDHTIVIEKTRLLVDGKERAKLPPEASKVELELTDGNLTVRADGQQVLSAPIGGGN